MPSGLVQLVRINWTSPFPIKRVSVFFFFVSILLRIENSGSKQCRPVGVTPQIVRSIQPISREYSVRSIHNYGKPYAYSQNSVCISFSDISPRSDFAFYQ